MWGATGMSGLSGDGGEGRDADFDPPTPWTPDEDTTPGGLLPHHPHPSPIHFTPSESDWYPGKDEDDEADAWHEHTSGDQPKMPDDLDHPRTFPNRNVAPPWADDIPF